MDGYLRLALDQALQQLPAGLVRSRAAHGEVWLAEGFLHLTGFPRSPSFGKKRPAKPNTMAAVMKRAMDSAKMNLTMKTLY